MTWTDHAHRIDPHILVNDEYRSKLPYTARPAFTERLRELVRRFATLSPEAVAYNPFRDAHTGRGAVLAPPRFR